VFPVKGVDMVSLVGINVVILSENERIWMNFATKLGPKVGWWN